MEITNKDGQALGRKGAESRARLLEAARALIGQMPAETLTASAVARAADLAPQTFYLYFGGVDEVLLSLAAEASRDTAEIVAALERPRDATAAREQPERIVAAFYRYWDRHRAILNIRNFRADAGQEAFLRIRNDSSMPIVEKVAALIRTARPASPPTEREAFARAVIIFAAIERMAARYASIVDWRSFVSSGDLKQAEAAILALLISPGG